MQSVWEQKVFYIGLSTDHAYSYTATDLLILQCNALDMYSAIAPIEIWIFSTTAHKLRLKIVHHSTEFQCSVDIAVQISYGNMEELRHFK